MKNEKGEITIKSIWKWLRSDKGKRYSFFIFYIFFFIIIFIFISYKNDDVVLENKEEQQEKEPEQQSSLPFKTNLFDNDYTFTYSIKFNDNTSDYLGKKNNSIITLNDDRGTYSYNYQNGELVYQGIKNPINYQEFLDSYEIKRIIKNSKLISETKLNQTGQYLYTYSITTGELNDLYNKENNYQDNLDNQIIVKTDLKKEIKSINLDISNYVKNDNFEVLTYEIIINYGDKNE